MRPLPFIYFLGGALILQKNSVIFKYPVFTKSNCEVDGPLTLFYFSILLQCVVSFGRSSLIVPEKSYFSLHRSQLIAAFTVLAMFLDVILTRKKNIYGVIFFFVEFSKNASSAAHKTQTSQQQQKIHLPMFLLLKRA